MTQLPLLDCKVLELPPQDFGNPFLQVLAVKKAVFVALKVAFDPFLSEETLIWVIPLLQLTLNTYTSSF